jgi:phosphoribosylformylglycinamidine (FGAM) synthase PurS component
MVKNYLLEIVSNNEARIKTTIKEICNTKYVNPTCINLYNLKFVLLKRYTPNKGEYDTPSICF